MPSTTNVLDEARELIERRLADLDEERRRLERALAELGGKVETVPGRPRGSASTTSAPTEAAPKASARRKNAVAVAVAPAPTRRSS